MHETCHRRVCHWAPAPLYVRLWRRYTAFLKKQCLQALVRLFLLPGNAGFAPLIVLWHNMKFRLIARAKDQQEGREKSRSYFPRAL